MTDLLIILGLVLVNGVFAGAEIAVIALRRTRLQELIEHGSRRAAAVDALRQEPERFLATVQIGITVVGAAAAGFGGATLAVELSPVLARIPGMGPHAHDAALVLVVALVSYLSLVLGELVPKSLALRSEEGYALLVARPLLALSWIARPFVWLLTTSSNVILRPFGDRTTFTESRLSPDELQQLVEEAARAGSLDARAGEIAARALEFAEISVAEVMVPRDRIVTLRSDASPDEIHGIITEVKHARLPVHRGAFDEIVGYVASREVLAAGWGGRAVSLAELLHPTQFVPETMKAVDLLHELQHQQRHLAMVVDEHGAVAGLVTLEDLLEELVGEILSERDTRVPLVKQEADGSALVPGIAQLREVNRALGLGLPEGKTWSTVAGLCISLAGAIPQAGTRVQSGDVELEIVAATPRTVRLVRIKRRQPSHGGEG